MDPRPPKLLPVFLHSFLSLWLCARGQSYYTIDTVGLTLLPGSTVRSGTPVTLRCQVSVSHDNLPNLTHTFLLTRDDIPIHSSTSTEDSVMYELNPARVADSGIYQCRVTVKGKNKASYSQKLNVTGLQSPVLYLNKTKPYENEEFTAICSAPEEKGPLFFRFYQKSRNGESKIIKQPAASWNSSETTLVLRTVGDSFLYCDYEINLVTGSRRSNRSNEVQVIVRGLYISPTMNVLPNPPLFEGDILEVICSVKSDLRNIEVFLTKDKRILKKAPHSTLSHRFTAQLDDSGELTCKAEWKSVQKETYHSIIVKELFSKPTLTLEPTDPFEGDRFKLNCSVAKYARERIDRESIKFAIYKNNVKLNNEDTFISVAHPQNNGNYSCKAQAASQTHSFIKESQKVVVEAKVPVSKPVLSVVGGTLVLGKPFKLLCHSDKGTLPVEYTLNGPHKMTQRKVVSKSGEKAIFDCPAIYKQGELNNFICHVKNGRRPAEVGLGQQLPRTTNIIEPVSDPLLAVLPNTGDVSEGQDLTLTCFVQRGTFPIRFTWYHTKRQAPLGFQNPNKLEASFSLKNVKAEDQGGYYCETTNSANQTKQSPTVTIGVKMAGWKKGLIGVFCLLLLLALILVFIFRKRLIHFKRKKTAELSVKSAGTKMERLSLTLAEVNEAANVTPGIMGKSVWSEHVSGSESDDQNSVTSQEKQEHRYTEVPPKQLDPDTAPVEKVEDNNQVCNSKQGVPEQTDGGSVEYAQLNHEANPHSAQDEQSVPDEHKEVNDSSDANNTAEQDATVQDMTPDS